MTLKTRLLGKRKKRQKDKNEKRRGGCKVEVVKKGIDRTGTKKVQKRG